MHIRSTPACISDAKRLKFVSIMALLVIVYLLNKNSLAVKSVKQHSKKRYVRRNIRLSCVKGNTEKTENTIAKNTQCKNDTVFSVINRGRNNNNLGGNISARVNIIIMIGSG